MTSVNSLVNENRRVTIRELSDRFGIGRSTINIIWKEKLDMNKVCARWIPRILSDDDKIKNIACGIETISTAISARG